MKTPAILVMCVAEMKCRVVVIEDHVDTAHALESLFQLHGLDTRVAYDAADGLAAIRAHRPHVVFSDLDQPGMSGFELAGQLRAEFGESLLLVAVSGRRDPDTATKARNCGFNVRFKKPADPEVLISVARSALALPAD